MRIAVLGSGAMGALYGGLLAADGADVTLIDVWEEHVRTIEQHGLLIETPDGETRTVDVPATTDPETVAPPDLLLVFVKSIHTEQAMADAAPLLDADVDVLTLQNGLGNPETIARHVPEANVIAGVTTHGATLEAPGRVRHAGEGDTTIGRYFASNDRRVREVANRLTAAGIPTDVTDAVQRAVWEKVLVNVGINAATALARVPNGALVETDPGQRLLESAVEEAAAVARAEGHDVREDIVEYTEEVAETTGENVSSMRQDLEAGRPTEVETLHGAVAARAERQALDAPVNRTLADLVRLAEHGQETR